MFSIRQVWRFTVVVWAGLPCVVLFSVGSVDTRAENLDESVIGVFKRNKCNDCHVPVEQRAKDSKTGKLQYPANRDFSFVLDLEKLKSSKYITPGVPDKSTLYKMILEEKMPEGAEFCFDATCPYPPLSDADRSIVEYWIRSLK